jgi:uncharacterized membrane protein (UPF0127 family)
MSRTSVVRLLKVLIITALAASAPALAVLGQNDLVSFEWDRLVIETAEGERHDFRVELAISPQQRRQGLMYRRDIAADAGMLFVHSPARVASMWMRNTYIPLDMLFIAEDGEIVKIAERTVPLSLKSIYSDQPVRGVLELNGGTAARLGLERGDRVFHRAFENGS